MALSRIVLSSRRYRQRCSMNEGNCFKYESVSSCSSASVRLVSACQVSLRYSSSCCHFSILFAVSLPSTRESPLLIASQERSSIPSLSLRGAPVAAATTTVPASLSLQLIPLLVPSPRHSPPRACRWKLASWSRILHCNLPSACAIAHNESSSLLVIKSSLHISSTPSRLTSPKADVAGWTRD